MAEAQSTVPRAKAMRVVGLLKRDRAQWRKAFHRECGCYDSLEEDYRRTLDELGGLLAAGDIESAREVIAERLESLD